MAHSSSGTQRLNPEERPSPRRAERRLSAFSWGLALAAVRVRLWRCRSLPHLTQSRRSQIALSKCTSSCRVTGSLICLLPLQLAYKCRQRDLAPVDVREPLHSLVDGTRQGDQPLNAKFLARPLGRVFRGHG